MRTTSLTLSIEAFVIAAAACFAFCTQGLAQAQPPTISRMESKVKAKSLAIVQIDAFFNVQDNCTSGPLPAVRQVRPPAHGSLIIKQGMVSATSYKNCLALQVPGFVLFYRSAPGYEGTDTLLLEVRYPLGRTELHRITIEVSSAGREI